MKKLDKVDLLLFSPAFVLCLASTIKSMFLNDLLSMLMIATSIFMFLTGFIVRKQNSETPSFFHNMANYLVLLQIVAIYKPLSHQR